MNLSLATGAQWDWAFAWEILPQLLSAMRVTVTATLLGMSLAVFGGLLLVMMRRSHIKTLSRSGYWTIEFIRGTPLLIQLYFFYYVLPEYGLQQSAMVTGVLALGLHYSSYMAEVYRAGIDAVPKGQWEAATALNFPPKRTFFTLILPQAIPPIVPASGNYLVAMFKDSVLLSTITVTEVLYTARDDIGSDRFRYLEPLTLVGVLFLIVSLISVAGIRRLERHLEKKR
ncbi:MAG: ectoine/hydroxyectoine ABC transporter permease subunit EhuD [Verrucomicrobia bacterium]|nr:ectoine/hydroxyectoine ABC transporter permease subunit EhuD [Verrucomicrobiota bacterium]MCH8512662.1 ectoine/hydroxyectoine ABC transporter permease subunit EhuD [Kiritimatiellia bacterium]